jgi:PAS domain S-box-containing protein
MKDILKLLIIVVSVFLIGYILEVAIDQSGLNNPDLVRHQLEILSELFSAFVAFSIFLITWHAYARSRDNHSLFLGSSFAVVGLLILFHMLSYPFMPDFITSNSSHKAAIFLMESRLILALSLIIGVYTYKDTFPKLINKRFMLSSVIALSAGSLAILPFYHDYIFNYLDPEKGYSPLTIFLISMNTAIILYTIYLYDKRIKETGQKNLMFLIYGSIIVIFSNMVYFFYEYSGHFLIITGFFFIYLALYKSSVELPYEKLAEAEEKLRRALEDNYRNLFNNANDAIITVDLEDMVTSWNKAAEKIFGWRTHEVIGRKLSFLIVPDELREKIEQFVGNALMGTGITGIETKCLHKDGSRIDVSLTISPILNTETEMIGVSEIFRDIRNCKKAEEELLKFKLGIERSDEVIFITNTDGTMIYANPAFENIYGFSREEVLGKTPRILKSGLLPSETYKQFWDTLLAKKVVSGELTNKTKDGRLLNIDGSANPILNDEGGIIGFLAIQRDITERKQAEKEKDKLLKAIDNTNDGIIIADETDQYIYLNEAYAEIYGYPEEELIGETWRKFVSPESIAATELELDRTIHNKNVGMLSGEFPGLRKDGTTVPLDVRSTGLWDEKGNYQGHICIIRDTTESKRAKEELAQSEEKYHTLIENIQDGVFIIQDAKMQFVNESFSRMTGCAVEEAIGKDFQLFVAPEDLEIVADNYRRRQAGEKVPK